MTRGGWIAGQAGHAAEHNSIDLLFRERLSATNAGIKGDGTADDTAATQTAIANLAASGGGELFFPNPNYKFTSPLALSGSGVRFIGSSRNKTKFRNVVSDMFTGSANEYEFAHIDMQTSAGHVFALDNLNRCHLHDLSLAVSNPNKSICNMDNLLGGAIQNVVERCNLTLTPNHAVPGWYHKSDGSVNCNVWRDCFCVNSGNYFFHIENVNIQNWAYDNQFSNMCFEMCDGGSIKLLSCRDAMIENCHEYDVAGQYKNDLYFIGRYPGAQPSLECSLRHCGRRGGSLAVGVYDVNVDDGRNILLDTVSSTGSGFSMRKGSASTVLILNEQARQIQVGMYAPDGTLWKQAVANGGAISTVQVS